MGFIAKRSFCNRKDGEIVKVSEMIHAIAQRSKQLKAEKANKPKEVPRYAGKVCPYCGGSGIRNETTMLPIQVKCSVCGGRGRIPN